MKVPFVDLSRENAPYLDDLNSIMTSLVSEGKYILGPAVQKFENEFRDYVGTSHALGLNSGTDALFLSLLAFGVGSGDEVITAPNSFIASASAIALTGARPVFADVREDLNIDPERISEKITSRTKAIIPVHLTGRIAPMNEITAIADKHNLVVIEDAAQAVGAEYENKKAGSLGDVGCFSFHPLKNLSSIGDGGAVVTNRKDIYEKLLLLRNIGLKNRDETSIWGHNSRLDSFHAAVLSRKLHHLEAHLKRKETIAGRYFKELSGPVDLPVSEPHERQTFQNFIIRTEERDALKKYLSAADIETKVHYPKPIHLTDAAGDLGHKAGDFPVAENLARRILSLPSFSRITVEEQNHVISTFNKFFS